jgi:hypothetical protein
VIRRYACAEPTCGAQVTLDGEKRTQLVAYPRGKGPLSEGYRPHHCPVAQGLWPPEIDLHPLAKRVR